MLGYFVRKIIGTRNQREVKKLRPLVVRINEIEQVVGSLSDEALREKTATWKAELATLEDKTALARRLDEILPEAFAVVKNTCRRLVERKAEIDVRGHKLVWDMIPFDVQLIGGNRPAHREDRGNGDRRR